MKAKIAGAVLATLMGVGFTGTASAAMVTETLSIMTAQSQTFTVKSLPLPDYTVSFTGYIRQLHGIGSGGFYYDEQSDLLTLSIGGMTPAGVSCGPFGCWPFYTSLFGLIQLHLNTKIVDPWSFKLDQSDFSIVNGDLFYGTEGSDFNATHSYTTTGVVFTVVPTPLPSALPMLGAAIVMLGGIGFIAKRKKVSAGQRPA